MAELMLSIMGAVAEFERSFIRERQLEGIVIAKKKNLYKGRKPKLSESQILILHEQLSAGRKKIDIPRELNISGTTFYKYVKKTPVNTCI